jgi:periplasmic protein CpxP/Spy
MKKIGLLLLSVMLVALVSQAQPRQRNFNPEDMAKRQTAQLKEALGLNADQEKQVYNLNLETGKKMKALRDENEGAGFEAMREKMGKIREENNKKMKETLTEAQWEKYSEQMEQMQQRRNQGGPGEGDSNRPAGQRRPGGR